MMKILFYDDDICVVDKPAGYVVHKTRGAENSPVMLQRLRDQVGKEIYPVHRLDRATSGCIAFAFSSTVANLLHAQLQSDGSVKRYLALCRGHFSKDGIFDRPLSDENKKKQSAVTKYRVLQEFSNTTLLDLEILTGRRHQIRRHLSFEMHHIVGDVNYGKGWLNRRFREEYKFHRMFLHCHYLSFVHPVTGERVIHHCDLDEESASLLQKLSSETQLDADDLK